MVRYRECSPSEHPHQGHTQQAHGQEAGREGQEPEQGLNPESIEAYGRTYRGRYHHRHRHCSRRRLYRIHRRRRRSSWRHRRRSCRHRRRHRRGCRRTRRRRRYRRYH